MSATLINRVEHAKTTVKYDDSKPAAKLAISFNPAELSQAVLDTLLRRGARSLTYDVKEQLKGRAIADGVTAKTKGWTIKLDELLTMKGSATGKSVAVDFIDKALFLWNKATGKTLERPPARSKSGNSQNPVAWAAEISVKDSDFAGKLSAFAEKHSIKWGAVHSLLDVAGILEAKAIADAAAEQADLMM